MSSNTSKRMINRYLKDKYGFDLELSNYKTVQELVNALSQHADPSIILIDSSGGFATFYTKSLETDIEYENRIKPYTARLRLAEENDKAEYARLRNKFENQK